jgi:tRNA 2-thiouridine synthesizing protein C
MNETTGEVDLPEETSGTVKKFMFVNRRAPYGTVYALEALEVVLISAAFDQDVSMVFIDDGVYELVRGQSTKAIDMKNFSPTYRALEGYDIEKLYVDEASLETRGLTTERLLVPVQVLNSEQMAELMDQQDVVISF